nr:phage head-tail connector protein [uncultured Anaerostipes sp.]DAZ10554.1 MAG TPA: Head Tail Connector Protein [Caudoviricetes sp.]
MTDVEKLKKLTGESDEELLSLLLEFSEQDLLRETKRTRLPDVFTGATLELAVIKYNRIGTEGETSRSQGGISTSFSDMPANIQKLVMDYRLARVGGKVYEAKEPETVPGENEDLNKR